MGYYRGEQLEKKRKSLTLLGIDPTFGIGDKILDYSKQDFEEDKKRSDNSGCYAFCPTCGRKQFNVNLLENGCFICGYGRK